MSVTTITLNRVVKRQLNELKKHPRESYNEVVSRLLERGVGDAESLTETIEILSSPEIMRSLVRSIEDLKRGRVLPIEKV